MTTTGYRLHGLQVLSPFALPEQLSADVDEAEAIIVRDLGTGVVPEGFPTDPELALEVGGRPMLSLHRHSGGGWELRCPGLLSFSLSEELDQISVLRGSETDPGFVPILLAGAALATVATLRGKVVLHASAVSTPQGAVAFAGPTGQGKSTVAALVAAAGAPLFTDDVLAVDLGTEVVAHRGVPVTRLRPHADPSRTMRAAAGAKQTVDGRLVLHLPHEAALELPLAAIVMPSLSTDADEVSLEVLPPGNAFQVLARCMRLNGWRTPDRQRQAIADTAQLAERVTIAVATIPTGRSLKSQIGLELLEALDGLN